MYVIRQGQAEDVGVCILTAEQVLSRWINQLYLCYSSRSQWGQLACTHSCGITSSAVKRWCWVFGPAEQRWMRCKVNPHGSTGEAQTWIHLASHFFIWVSSKYVLFGALLDTLSGQSVWSGFNLLQRTHSDTHTHTHKSTHTCALADDLHHGGREVAHAVISCSVVMDTAFPATVGVLLQNLSGRQVHHYNIKFHLFLALQKLLKDNYNWTIFSRVRNDLTCQTQRQNCFLELSKMFCVRPQRSQIIHSDLTGESTGTAWLPNYSKKYLKTVWTLINIHKRWVRRNSTP